MFSSINIYGLVSTEFYQYLKLVSDKVGEANPEALKLKSSHEALVLMLKELMASLNLETANAETKVIQALDSERDNAFNGLNFSVRGYALHKDPVLKEAAELLQAFIKAQGNNIARLNYASETTVLSKITSTFTSEEKYKKAVAALGFQSWLTNLEEANVAFETRYKVRNTDISVNADVPSFTDVKKKAIPVYFKLIDLIEGRYNTANEDKQPTEPYQKLINEINTIIDSFSSYASKPKPKPEA